MVFKNLFLSIVTTFAVCVGYACAEQSHSCVSYPCAAGLYCSNNSCVSCHVGHYCVNNNEYECSRNTYTALEGQSSCQTCPSDMPYANEQHIFCTPCNSGAFVVEDWVCVACPSGQYANPEHTECLTNCDDGTVVEGVCQPNQQTECDPGAYLVNGNCVECNAGYYCVGGQTGMQICPKGSFSAAAQSECAKCPDGYTTDSDGTSYVAATDLSTICKAKKAKLKMGNTEKSLPICLREGRINRSVVRVKNN